MTYRPAFAPASGRWAPPLRSLAAALLVAAAGSGCGDDEACPGANEYGVCDISDPACVRQVAEVLGCRREVDAAPDVPIRFTTRDALASELFGSSDNVSDDEILWTNRAYAALANFSLLPPDYRFEAAQADFSATIGAYYDPTAKQIVVVTDSDDSARDAYVTLVHEMVHAQQDAAFGLDRYAREHAYTEDRSLAVRAAIEGEAMTYQLLAEVELEGLSAAEINWDVYFSNWQAGMLSIASETDIPLILASRLFPYAFGGQMVFDRWFTSGRGGVAVALEPPPTSTRQVLAWPRTDAPVPPWNQDEALMDRIAPEMPESYVSLGWSFEGTWLIRAMVERKGRDFGPAEQRAVELIHADVLSLHYEASTDTAVAVWRLSFDDDDARSVIQASLEETSDMQTVVLTGGDLVLIAGGPPNLVDETTPWQALDEARTRLVDFSRPPLWPNPRRRSYRHVGCQHRHLIRHALVRVP